MHRFYLPPAECNRATLLLTGREAYHALRVLRVRRGDRVTVLDGSGTEFLCDIRNANSDEIRLVVAQKNSIPPPPCQITLLQALPKGGIFESIVQKAAELGVHRILPLLSGRVVAHFSAEDGVNKRGKWRQVAIEAIKQCGSAWLPEIETPVTPAQFLARKEKFDLPLIGSLQSDRRHPRDYFQAFESEHGRMPGSVCIWIGPEGDFTPAEVRAIQSDGALPISLGRLVLRVETAATYCLSILNYELQSK
jgi:16S rRNA (uracil1498-N3)-methyltransferase